MRLLDLQSRARRNAREGAALLVRARVERCEAERAVRDAVPAPVPDPPAQRRR